MIDEFGDGIAETQEQKLNEEKRRKAKNALTVRLEKILKQTLNEYKQGNGLDSILNGTSLV